MTDSTDDTQPNTDFPGADELALLKTRATAMGISYSPNIGLETLRERVNAKMNGNDDKEGVATPAPTGAVDGPGVAAKVPPHVARRKEVTDKAMALVRCRITCLNPDKREWPGEIITVVNKYTGAVKVFVPFGEQTDEGWHIPQIIFNKLKARKFLDIRTTKEGPPIVRWAPEFGLEVLPTLTQEELDKLAAAQAASGSVQSGNTL